MQVGNVDLRRPFLIKGEQGLTGLLEVAELQQQLTFFETSFKKQHTERSSSRGQAVMTSPAVEHWLKALLPKRRQQHEDSVVEVKSEVHGAMIKDEAGGGDASGWGRWAGGVRFRKDAEKHVFQRPRP